MDLQLPFLLPFLTILISSLGFGFTLLKNQSEGRDKLIHLLEEHEEKDEARYLEVLKRFEKIAVSLAKSGIENGTAYH